LAPFADRSRSLAYRDQFVCWAPLWYAALARRIYRRAPVATSILDLGTGPGKLLAELAHRYRPAQLIGLDQSAAMLELARCIGPDCSVRLVQASFDALPFRDNAFDLVTATAILHHADCLTAMFREVRRVLVPGGRFVALAFRRDPGGIVRALARRHSAAARRRGNGLEGLEAVIDASWTVDDLQEAWAAAGFRAGRVCAGILQLELVATA
jgi:ubiquinone/menaquinone biosynthesis C-methylase UbiE